MKDFAEEGNDAVLMTRKAEYVVAVELNRPHARNAVNGDITRGLSAALARTEADPSCRVVILKGQGSSFCAGADLKEIAAGNRHLLITQSGGFAGFVYAPRTKVWIAQVQGPALAGGLELALACDLIVASETASFALPEVKRGLIAAAGGLHRLVRAVSMAKAMRLILTGEQIDAATADAWGLLAHLASPEQLERETFELAEKIAANAPLAVRESRALVGKVGEVPLEQILDQTRTARELLAKSHDLKEGALAFIEKRKPNWTGT